MDDNIEDNGRWTGGETTNPAWKKPEAKGGSVDAKDGRWKGTTWKPTAKGGSWATTKGGWKGGETTNPAWKPGAKDGSLVQLSSGGMKGHTLRPGVEGHSVPMLQSLLCLQSLI